MPSETPDIISISSHHKIEVLSESELETLKNGTLQLLSEVGVHFPTKKALTIFADHGADVDWENEIVRISPELVKKAMSTAPRSFVLGDIPVYSLVGGKWTSYRAFSEQVSNKVLAHLGKPRKADTKRLPIGGGRDQAAIKGSPEYDQQLFTRYGSRCREVVAYQIGDDAPLQHYPDMTNREVVFLTKKRISRSFG